MISGRYSQVTKLWLSGGHSVLGPSVTEPNGLQTISNHHLGYTLINRTRCRVALFYIQLPKIVCTVLVRAFLVAIRRATWRSNL